MRFGPFADHNGVALPPDAAQAVADRNKAAGKTDDGTRDIAKPLPEPVPYYDPTLPPGHGVAILARNTLQVKHAEDNGFVKDKAEAKRLYRAAQDAKDAETGE
jgi:hypothetical protein